MSHRATHLGSTANLASRLATLDLAHTGILPSSRCYILNFRSSRLKGLAIAFSCFPCRVCPGYKSPTPCHHCFWCATSRGRSEAFQCTVCLAVSSPLSDFLSWFRRILVLFYFWVNAHILHLYWQPWTSRTTALCHLLVPIYIL